MKKDERVCCKCGKPRTYIVQRFAFDLVKDMDYQTLGLIEEGIDGEAGSAIDQWDYCSSCFIKEKLDYSPLTKHEKIVFDFEDPDEEDG